MSNVGVKEKHTGSSIIHVYMMNQSDMMVNNIKRCLTTTETVNSSTQHNGVTIPKLFNIPLLLDKSKEQLKSEI